MDSGIESVAEVDNADKQLVKSIKSLLCEIRRPFPESGIEKISYTVYLTDPIMVVAMSVFGGVANFFKSEGPPNWAKILAALVTSAFSGLLSYQITIAMGFDIHVQCIVAGIAGYGGGTMLDETYQKIHDFIMKKADDNLNSEMNKKINDDRTEAK